MQEKIGFNNGSVKAFQRYRDLASGTLAAAMLSGSIQNTHSRTAELIKNSL